MTDLIRGESPFFVGVGGRCADSCGGARFARTRIEGRKWEKVEESGTVGKILGRRKDIVLEYNNYTVVKYKDACAKSRKAR